jgi:hypothetical protein
MRKTITIFDVVMGLMIIMSAFYLAAITHIMPLPENVLTRVTELSLDVFDVLLTCIARLIGFLP